MWSTPAAAARQRDTARATPPDGVILALFVIVVTSIGLFACYALRGRRDRAKAAGRGKGLPKSVARAAYESLRARELAWLRGLPPQTQAALAAAAAAASNGGGKGGGGKGRLGGEALDGAVAVFSGEVGMVLLGVKPCVVVEDRGGVSGFGEAHAEGVVRWCCGAFVSLID